MPRARRIPASLARRKKVLKRAKGFVGGRGRLYRTARVTVMRAMAFATRDRKRRKRMFRRLWITRINAACRKHGVSYSKFIAGLQKAHVALNRKSLAEIAVHDEKAFQDLVHLAMKK